jgi:hypothetical protein
MQKIRLEVMTKTEGVTKTGQRAEMHLSEAAMLFRRK